MKNYVQLILVWVILLILSLLSEWLDEKSADNSLSLFNK